MNLQGKLTLAFLEEDRPQGGLFRVKPLINDDTVFSTDLTQDLPDDGYLRVVPDKNEQRTFKARMRELGPLCVIDLRNEAKGKVKKNRNYRPDKQENNQYVVYSDVIRPCPADRIFQVVQESGLENAVTEKVYIRSGANIQGPCLKNGEAAGGSVEKLPPDSRFLRTVDLPDGRALLLYWPDPEPEAPLNAADQIQALNEDLKGLANPLKETTVPAPETPTAAVGKGTPLFPAPIAAPSVKKTVNPLAQAVEAQRRNSTVTAEDTRGSAQSVLPEGLRSGLRSVMKTESGRRELSGLLRELGGADTSIGSTADHTDESGLPDRLQDLEAERLRLIMQLDEAKKDQKAFAEKLIRNAQSDKKRELDALERIIGEKRRDIGELTEKQEALLKASSETQSAAAGQCPEPEEMLRQVLDAFHVSGFTMTRTEAAALLAVIAQCGGVFAVSTVESSDTVIFAGALKDAFGTPVRICARPSGTPVSGDCLDLRCVLSGVPDADENKVFFVPSTDCALGPGMKYLYTLDPFPFVPLPRAQGILKAPLPQAAVPVSATWLRHTFAARDLDLEAQDQLRGLQGKLPAAVLRLCAGLISAVRPHAEGSLGEVIDLALSYCAVPWIRIEHADTAGILPLIKGMPRTLRMLSDGQ